MRIEPLHTVCLIKQTLSNFTLPMAPRLMLGQSCSLQLRLLEQLTASAETAVCSE